MRKNQKDVNLSKETAFRFIPSIDRVLMQLYYCEKPKELALSAKVSRAQIYRILNSLAKEGFAARETETASNRGRPATTWKLTDKGKLKSYIIRQAWTCFFLYLFAETIAPDFQFHLANFLVFSRWANNEIEKAVLFKELKWGRTFNLKPSRVIVIPVYYYSCPLCHQKAHPSFKACTRYPCGRLLLVTDKYAICFIGDINKRSTRITLKKMWNALVDICAHSMSAIPREKLEMIENFYKVPKMFK